MIQIWVKRNQRLWILQKLNKCYDGWEFLDLKTARWGLLVPQKDCLVCLKARRCANDEIAWCRTEIKDWAAAAPKYSIKSYDESSTFWIQIEPIWHFLDFWVGEIRSWSLVEFCYSSETLKSLKACVILKITINLTESLSLNILYEVWICSALSKSALNLCPFSAV